MYAVVAVVVEINAVSYICLNRGKTGTFGFYCFTFRQSPFFKRYFVIQMYLLEREKATVVPENQTRICSNFVHLLFVFVKQYGNNNGPIDQNIHVYLTLLISVTLFAS